MQDFDELWNEYAAGFNDKLESENGGDWDQLDEVEQEIAALWKLAADMYSGGFDEFFSQLGLCVLFLCYARHSTDCGRKCGLEKSGLQ